MTTGYLNTLLSHARQVPPGIRPRRALPFEEALQPAYAEESVAVSSVPPAPPSSEQPVQAFRASRPVLRDTNRAVHLPEALDIHGASAVPEAGPAEQTVARTEAAEVRVAAKSTASRPSVPAEHLDPGTADIPAAVRAEQGRANEAQPAAEQVQVASRASTSVRTPALTVEQPRKRVQQEPSDPPRADAGPVVDRTEMRRFSERPAQAVRPEIGGARTPPAAPTVEIHIGRIDVRAGAAPRPERASRPTPALSLNDYLEQTRP